MAEDIWSALNQTYIKSATAERDEQKSTITKGYTTEFKNDLDIIQRFAKKERDTFKEIAKEEAKLHQLSLQYKRDIFKQESQHYNNIYNLNAGIHKKQVSFLEQERDIRAEIAKSGKASLGDLASLYTKRKQLEELEKQSIEYKEQQFKKGVDTVKQAFGTIIQHIMNYVNEWDNLMRWNQWEKGIKDSGSQYEQNFTEIAGRLGSNYQIDTHNVLKDSLSSIVNNSTLKSGLNFNNEVFPEITEAVKKGFTTDAEDIAISNAIDKKIMPWLETSSETWVQMQYNMTDDALLRYKSDQLMLQATQEGNRLLQTGVIGQITDSILPSLDNIVANTTEVEDLNDEMYAKVMYLINDMGYSKQEAIKAVNKEIEAYQNPFKALTSGDTGDKLLAIDNLWGTDLVGNFASSMIGSGWAGSGAFFDLTGLASGGETRTERGLLTYAGMENAQNKYIKQYNLDGDNRGKYDISKLLEYTTATQQHDNTKQNLAADAVFDKNLQVHGIDLAALQLNELKEIKTWLITGLAVLLLTKLTDKMTDGFIKNVLSKFKGGGGSSGGNILGNISGKLGGGLIPGAGNFPGAGKLGFMSSGTGAVLGSAAGVTAGALIAKEGFNEWQESSAILKDKTASDIQKENAKNGKWSSGTAVAGGVAGAAGILALGASNPIGWAALAIGGVALAINKYQDHLAELDDATAHITRSFNESKQTIESEANAREDQLFAIQNNITSLKTTDEKLEYLQKNGINTTLISKQLEGKTTDEVNKQLQIYLDNLITQNSQDAEDAQTLIDDISADFKNQFNDNVDDVKDKLLENYSAEAIEDRLKKEGKSHDKDDIWKEQKKALSKLGYTDSELNSLYYHWKNGAAGKSELEDFLDSGAVQGDNIGSFEDHVENGKVDASKVNYVLRQAGVNNIELQDAETISRILGTLATDIIYLHNNQKYGRETDKVTTGLPIDFTQEKYDTAKANILAARSDSKNILDMAFKNLGHNDAMSDWPNSLKGFKLGSAYIPNDMIAMLHAGERVLTAGQNKEYTNELTSGNSTSSIIQAGVQDIVMAIKTQTSEIINYLSTMSFNNSSFGSSHINMLPAMGNTKVTL